MDNSQLTVSGKPTSHLNMFFGFNSTDFDRVFNIPLELLSASDAHAECWLTDAEPMYHREEPGAVYIQAGDHVLILIEGQHDQVSERTAYSYNKAYAISHKLNMPNLIRTWNYFPDIHWQVSGLENYQRFCVARYETLMQLDKHRAPYPAATAIGSKNKQYTYAFFFSREEATVIENNRQVSAWEYPRMYSPKQPVFSRAVQFQKMLICSGTASVVGHETRHVDDFESQFSEMLKNIQVLIDSSEFDYELQSGYYKFYLRDRENLADLLALIQQHQLQHYMIFEGDICRESLLLESEAVFV